MTSPGRLHASGIRPVQVVRNGTLRLAKVLPINQQRTADRVHNNVHQIHVAMPPPGLMQAGQQPAQRVPIFTLPVRPEIKDRS